VGQQNYQKILEKVVVKAWSDADFKARLLKDPAGVLKEHGIPVPESLTAKMVEDSDTVRHLILPAPPGEELSVEELNKVAGGTVQVGNNLQAANIAANIWKAKME
jgi:hypothetical protein